MFQATKEVGDLLNKTITKAVQNHYEYITPEQLLLEMTELPNFCQSWEECGGDTDELRENLISYIKDNIEVKQEMEQPTMTDGFQKILIGAEQCMYGCGKSAIELSHIVNALYALEESYAVYYMESQRVDRIELLIQLGAAEEGQSIQDGEQYGYVFADEVGGEEEDEEFELEEEEEYPARRRKKASFQEFTVCLNDNLEGINPLVGREMELERTIQVLCRKEKNNPLHIGEPGVGKTVITYGLARLLNEGKVPDVLKGARIYALDLSDLIAGTQYRGEFEKRFKGIMESIKKEEKPIVYIDEIHNIVGAGATGEGSFDVSNMLKPYLSGGKVRFIGATTYEEYKKHFEKSKSLVRRFQNIEIKEPSVEETITILKQLKKYYESFHGVRYGKDVLPYAVEMSAKYMAERFLPDKAIDLLDEAGAYRQLHPLEQKVQTVGKDVIDEILSKICKIPKETVEQDDVGRLKTLEQRLSAYVFGQAEAIREVTNAIKFSKAGLLEESKPLASLLFVGPTGVGKTEVAKTLAKELGIPLIRFDMSEYEEKHAVAKLIGSPAGYVGYEEGGLLTEEVRRRPHAVLLLDEIEKAHPDIYNILLQVMDYATLTDNQGRKADFRNIVFIMTSNAGASQIGRGKIGFGKSDIREGAMMEEVKRVFQPEFRNRLSRIVVFHGMDEKMAEAITEKKLKELSARLEKKKVCLKVSAPAMAYVKEKGISREYGAREIDRVIQGEVKPLLVDEILFGRLKRGGSVLLTVEEGKLRISIEKKKKEMTHTDIKNKEKKESGQ